MIIIMAKIIMIIIFINILHFNTTIKLESSTSLITDIVKLTASVLVGNELTRTIKQKRKKERKKERKEEKGK